MAVNILNDEEKQEILGLWRNGYTKTSIAQLYRVSARTIGRVLDEVAYDSDFELKKPPKDSYNYVASKMMISIIRNSDGRGVSITKDSEGFTDAYELIVQSGGSQEALEKVFTTHDVVTKWSTYEYQGLKIDPEQGTVTYDVGNIHVDFKGRLVSRLIDVLKSGDNKALHNLVDFALNLLHNPDKRAVNELYDFLEASDIEIVEDGMVLCWKRVRDDYKDCYTGTIDNSPGTIVQVPRSEVDPDSENTCSHGLHVCSRDYLSSYHGDRVVRVLVNPADFVAIPSDYNYTKARVCKYYVEADVTEQMKQFM